MWNTLSRKLQDLYPGLVGVRVLEPHEKHGLHYHLLVNQRISVHVMRQFALESGFGDRTGQHGIGPRRQWPWVKVVRATPGSAQYLAKYLSKHFRLFPGMRKWGMIGGFKGVKKNAIEIDSIAHRAFQLVKGKLRWRWSEASALFWECVHHGKLILERWEEIRDDTIYDPQLMLGHIRSFTQRRRNVQRALEERVARKLRPVRMGDSIVRGDVDSISDDVVAWAKLAHINR